MKIENFSDCLVCNDSLVCNDKVGSGQSPCILGVPMGPPVVQNLQLRRIIFCKYLGIPHMWRCTAGTRTMLDDHSPSC